MAQQYVAGQFVRSDSWMRKVLPNNTPTHGASGTLVSEMMRQFGANPTGGVGWNSGAYGIGSVTVHSNDPVRTMRRTNDGATWQIRVPDVLPVPSGTDGSVVIWDPTSDRVVEGWQVSRDGANWKCTWGGYKTGVSQWDGLYSNSDGIAAAGTSFLSQFVTIDDMKRAGPIGHVVGIAIAHNYGQCWPANRTDGHGGKPGNPIKMGQRFRFPSNINLSGLSAPARKVAEAVRDYGLVVLDTTAQPWETWPLWCQINAEKDDHGHYGQAFGGDPGGHLRSIPWNQMVALPDGYDGGTPGEPPPEITGVEILTLTLAKVATNPGGDVVKATWTANKDAAQWTAHIGFPGGTTWQTTLPGTSRTYEFWNVPAGAVVTISAGTSTTRSATYADANPTNNPPTPGSLTTTTTATGIEGQVTGAADTEGLHAAPYAFRLETAGVWSAWSGWSSLASTTFPGLTPATTYRVQHKVRDSAGQEVTGTPATVTTPSAAAELPTGLVPGVSTGHLAHHAELHAAANQAGAQLPATVTDGLTGHLAHHVSLKAWYDQAHPGAPLPAVTGHEDHDTAHELMHEWRNTEGAGGNGGNGGGDPPPDGFVVGDSILHPNYIGEGSVFQRDVSSMPLASNSAAMAAYMRQDQINTGYSTAFNVYQYNFPTYIVRSSEMQMADTTWRNMRNWTWTPEELMGTVFSKSNLTPALNKPAFAPIPEDAVPATGTDSSIAIYDADTDTLWEWWQMIKTGTRQWAAEWGSRTLNASKKYNGQADIGSVCAAGLMGSLLQIGIGEVQAGWINHALGLIILAPRRGWSWPARQDDGWVDDVNAPFQGQWCRLNPALNIEAQSWNPLLKMVCRAVQTYGMTCFDKGGAVAFSGESGAHWPTNPWPGLIATHGGGLPEWEVFAQFPWEQTQWAPRDWGKP